MFAGMETTAAMFKLLSEPVRLRILGLLSRGELCVCDLMAVLGLPQSTVSRHLGRLAKAGFLTGRRNGKWMHYRLAEGRSGPLAPALALCRELLADSVEAAADLRALERHLKNKSGPPCAG